MKHWKILSFLLLPFLGEAGGFQLNTQSQKAISVGGSITGAGWDASVCYFNPGGLATLKSGFMNAGVSILKPQTAFLGLTDESEAMSSKLYTPFYFYGSYPLNEKITVGLSVNSPYSLGSKWEDDWSGRYISTSTRFNTMYYQPTLAFKINDRLSIGAAPVFATGKAIYSKALPVSGGGVEGEQELKVNGKGFGFNAGVMITLDQLSLGVSYKSKIKMKLEDGEATFRNIPSSLLANGAFPSSAAFHSAITLPSLFSVGAAYTVNEKWTTVLDINYTGWDVYDSLVFEFNDYPAFTSRNAKKYKNSFAIRAGVRYQYTERLILSGGLAFDQSPVQDAYVSPELPDADKIVVGAGLNYALKKGWSLEFSLFLEDFKERKEADDKENNFVGTYKSNLYGAGIGVEYKF